MINYVHKEVRNPSQELFNGNRRILQQISFSVDNSIQVEAWESINKYGNMRPYSMTSTATSYAWLFFHLEQTYWIDILCKIQSYKTYKENLVW